MIDLHYNEYGKGNHVVLLHGFCENGEVWDGFVDALSKKFHLLIPDLPGFGKSALPTGNFSIENIGQLLGTWLEKINIDNCTVIGHSLGGYVSLSLAKQHPDLVNKIGLFHSSALPDTDEKKESRDKTIEFIQKYGVKTFAQSFAPALFYEGNRHKVKGAAAKIIEMAEQLTEESLVAYTKAMRDRNDHTNTLKEFEKPILFIAGDQDNAVPLEKTKMQIGIPKKPFVHILENTGHMGMYEKREECLSILEEFLTL